MFAKLLSPITTSLAAKTRLDMVSAIFKEHGHVNRHLISEKLVLTKLQASQLLREFLHVHAPLVAWDGGRNAYRMTPARRI